ncbi:GNAT family N-acetyltransferase [Nocardioides sp. CER19]|uniref:GNAT family N-acetyltransferase n=1 Tax=Nocardioides sp. CER19 TaxID=3038538 RepID=UPI00244D548A|nr:GNAT family N-acetyltransferase [Nocardioides sp. CER19]MDH2412957.1 GNAT family N-acetyltransferase [Nocardioides sp. CER19]
MVLTLAPVATERLSLPLWDAPTVAAIRSGQRLEGWHPEFPREDDRDAASLWHDGDVWGPRSIVRGVTTLGSVGFFGPPSVAQDGVPETEVGYGLVAEAWGWGFATEALRALLGHTDEAGVRLRASVAPENARSLRVLAKCGFTELRGPSEDGELVLARPLPGART